MDSYPPVGGREFTPVDRQLPLATQKASLKYAFFISIKSNINYRNLSNKNKGEPMARLLCQNS